MAPNISGTMSDASAFQTEAPFVSSAAFHKAGDGKADSDAKSEILTSVSKEHWHSEGLTVVVIGASGDLAKKKTYPSLLDLFANGLLPDGTLIYGYARSPKTHESLREHLKPYLLKHSQTVGYAESVVHEFLERCFYQSGKSYGDFNAYYEMVASIREYEESQVLQENKTKHNRLFYLAIPPNVFGETGVAIKKTAMQLDSRGWSRVIIEKPFGRDLDSCNTLSKTLATQFHEHHLYRIDHYLGKEMVQNLLVLRFGNSWLEWMWHRNAIQGVMLTFKEPFGTEGRGGYFDQYGIIRDILQNHLLQVLTLLTMEPPGDVDGPDAGDRIRDAKVQILKSIPKIQLEDALLGQYEGYSDDETIQDKNTNCPTFAMLKLNINTPRWSGVPFILQAGKALDEKVCEVRIQFRPPPAVQSMFSNSQDTMVRNELVIRLQPNPGIFMTTNIKTPGFSSSPTSGALSMDYENQFESLSNPDAYTRLILDVLRGRQGSFVRDDELRRSWEIFTPLLHKIENENIRPLPYKYGSNGPVERKCFLEKVGAFVEDDVPSTFLGEKITSSL